MDYYRFCHWSSSQTWKRFSAAFQTSLGGREWGCGYLRIICSPQAIDCLQKFCGYKWKSEDLSSGGKRTRWCPQCSQQDCLLPTKEVIKHNNEGGRDIRNYEGMESNMENQGIPQSYRVSCLGNFLTLSICAVVCISGVTKYTFWGTASCTI